MSLLRLKLPRPAAAAVGAGADVGHPLDARGQPSRNDPRPRRQPTEMQGLTLLLFAFWVLLSGKLDPFHLGLGAASAYAVATASRRLFALPPRLGVSGVWPMDVRTFVALVRFVPFLVWEVVRSNVEVAWIVLQRDMPIQPRLERTHLALPHDVARLTLANAITLTPGTVTVDVEGDDYVVHALTASSAQSIEAEARLMRRVREIFVPRGGRTST